MTTIRIPDLLAPLSQWPTAVHPDSEEIAQVSEEWLSSLHPASPAALKAFFKQKFGLAGGMAWPLGDKNSLRIAADWSHILFSYDDLLDDAVTGLMQDESGTAAFSKIIISTVADTENFKPVPSLPIATAWHDWMTRFRATSPPGVTKRFVDSIIGYAKAANTQNGLRERHTSPRVEEFVIIRRDTGAVKTCFPVVEHSLRIEVPEKAIQHPVIKELHDASNDIICWANEIISFNREQAQGDHFNLVAIVSIEKEIPVQVAVEYVYLMIESRVDQWSELCAQIPKFDPETDEIVSKYVRGLELMTTGLTHWSFKTERYFGPHETRQVKDTDTMSVRVLPLEPWAAQTTRKLRYTVVGV